MRISEKDYIEILKKQGRDDKIKEFYSNKEKRNPKIEEVSTSKSNRKSKYNNKRIVVDGIRFDSITEYERYEELLLFEKSGYITDLKYHAKEDRIILQEDPLIRYEPDFSYRMTEDPDVKIVEDLKGYQTNVFKLKKKLVIGMIKRKELHIKFILTKKENGKFKIIENY